ncbi:MAG: MBL fold metallo-hydrolase [Planctomycetaceae bacterium]|nr:MBL fold metallo-hydrolase [Planctomycetaceae bacterium]
MPLNRRRDYFVAKSSVVLRSGPGRGGAENHLLLGDWLRWLGETDGDWEKVRCRGDVGWLKRDDFGTERALEVNFVDIGQGDGCHIVTPQDEVILIDAGVGSNMNRFLSWRYNLRGRNVKRAADFDDTKGEQSPFPIDHVVISHPDNDHYFGFLDVFNNLKLQFKNVYHNGIVERPDDLDPDPNLNYSDDLGGYTKGTRPAYVWDVVSTTSRMKKISGDHPKTRKQFLKTIRALLTNSPSAKFDALSRRAEDLTTAVHMGPFDGTASIQLKVLGPLTERITYHGTRRNVLRKLGNEGQTKNGHSVILQLQYGRLKVMLGGDLNTQAQDFLLQHYTSVSTKASTLEKKLAKLNAKGSTLTASEQTTKARTEAALQTIVKEGRTTFECDITKACHHGSSHFTDTFMQAINATATVISSGDEESHSHPRPDALGAFGKHGRGERPLIFSTELARSTREFTPVIRFLDEIREFEAAMAKETDPTKQKELLTNLESRRDRNVAVYGMITLRALGDKVLLAQKLEAPRKPSSKWDIYNLHFNAITDRFEYAAH